MSMGGSAAHRAAPFIIGILALCLVGAAQASGQGLKPSRVHFVDRVGNNALFRGNEPLGNGSSETFAYDALIEEITKKAYLEANWSMEGPIYLVDMSFEYIEHSDIKAEENFFNENTHLGRYIKYPIFGAPFPPWVVGEKVVKYLANGPIWVADELPKRMGALRSLLETADNGGGNVVVYGHCEAGCDRTGEFMAAYYMQYKNMTVQEAWEHDTSDCGREPYHLNEFAIGWYCEYLKLNGLGDHLEECTITREVQR